MRILNEEQIEILLEERKGSLKKAEENNQLIEENKRNFQSLEEENKNFQNLIEENTNRLYETAKRIRTLRKENEELEIRDREIDEELRQDKREKEILELIESQPDFFEILEERIKSAQENTSSNISGFIQLKEPDKASAYIRTLIGSREFSPKVIELRTIKTNYEKKIKDLCSRKVDGINITLIEAKEPQDYLDYCVTRFPIIEFWQ